MCGDDEAGQEYDPVRDELVHSGAEHGDGLTPPSRRGFLIGTGAALAASGLVLPGGRAQAAPAATRKRNALAPGGDSSPATRTAMHVHTNDEGSGPHSASAGIQFQNADEVGVDLLVLTPHSHRQRATFYLTSLDDAKLDTYTTGSGGIVTLGRQGSHDGTLTFVAQAGTGPVSGGFRPIPAQAKNRLRTTIAGHTVTLTFGPVQLDPGTAFEMRVPLSTHAAYRSLRHGNYALVHRFTADAAPGLSYEDNGFTGVVTLPVPAAGNVLVIDMVQTIQGFWADMVAKDNCFFDLLLSAGSSRSGARADVTLSSLTFHRSSSDPASLVQTFSEFLSTYGARHPDLTTWAASEISGFSNPHINYFGVPQRFPHEVHGDTAEITRVYDEFVDQVHREGGAVSLNHPFGPTGGPPLSAPEQSARVREVAAQLLQNDRYGSDILEVAYFVRGYVTIEGHLALWDVLSQHGMFVTGNGVNDDHSGRDWKGLGFLTGTWTASRQAGDVVAALTGGRAYATHPGYWPFGHLDMQLVAGRGAEPVPMGGVTLAAGKRLTIDVTAVNLPPGGKVELWAGRMDSGSLDPNTGPIRTFNPGDFGVSAIASVDLGAMSDTFFRAIVRNSSGRIVGVGNPIWVLRSTPPGGIPAPRRH